MEQIYEPGEFIEALDKRTGESNIKCPVCGSERFTSTEYLAGITIGKDKKNLSLGPCIPAGMLICTNCGHIDFFSLGALGLLKNEKESSK